MLKRDRSHGLVRYVLVLVLFACGAAFVYQGLRAPQPGRAPRASGRGVPAARPASTSYGIGEGEVARYVPAPSEEDRLSLFRELGVRAPGPVRLVTLYANADGRLRLRDVEVGESPIPVSLDDVLARVLQVPAYALVDRHLARDIHLPGDRVLREGVDPTDYLPYVAARVRELGYDRFEFAREERLVRGYVARGHLQIPQDALTILPAPPHAPAAMPRKGNPATFLQALANAIQRPIRNECVCAPDAALIWIDNSCLYSTAPAGAPIPADLTQQTLAEVAEQLNVAFEPTEEQRPVWRVRGR